MCDHIYVSTMLVVRRLQRHESLAMQKYTELDQMLHSDPRLRMLGNR